MGVRYTWVRGLGEGELDEFVGDEKNKKALWGFMFLRVSCYGKMKARFG